VSTGERQRDLAVGPVGRDAEQRRPTGIAALEASPGHAVFRVLVVQQAHQPLPGLVVVVKVLGNAAGQLGGEFRLGRVRGQRHGVALDEQVVRQHDAVACRHRC